MSTWPTVLLGSICEFRYGRSLPAEKRVPGDFQVYGSNGPVGSHNQALTSGPAIVIGRKGSFGEVTYSASPCWPIDTTYYIDSTVTQCDLRWLAYRLADLGLKELNRAAAVPGLNRDDAYRKKLLMPPLEEQREIAVVLDQIDELRVKRCLALRMLDDLEQTVFLDMFGDPATNPRGWPMKKVGDLIESAKYGTSEKSVAEGPIPVMRMGNITPAGEIDLSDLKYMSNADVDERYLVRSGDILFNRTNSAELVGKTAIYRGADILAFAGYLVRVRTDKENNPEYLAAFMNSAYTKRVLRGMAKSIVGMANINAKELQGIAVAEPPLELQQAFADRVQLIESRKAAQRAQLAILDELFASVKFRAFRGELFV